jgi:cation transport regulator ChaB
MPSSKEELPGTLKRSPKKAQDTYRKTLDSAHDEYRSEEQAHRVAYASLKHSFQKVGDHWEPKKGGRKGPSDPRSRSGGPNAKGATAGGIDVEGSTKRELYDRAKRAGLEGRSQMSKMELAKALARKQG